MKVLLINGSPHEKGCTYTALSLIAGELNAAGIETEILNVGTKPVGGCIGCGGCAAGKGCVFGGVVNEAIEKAKTADGFVFGSPVHYASASGNMTSFMDRLAYAGGRYLAYKPAAICCSARRAGTTSTLDQLVKYPEFFHMPLVSGSYWPMVHGSNPEQVLQDAEGCAVMQELGRNMAWLLRCIEAGKAAGIMKERATFTTDLWDLTSFFFEAPREYEEKQVRKYWKGQNPAILRELRDVLAGIDDFSLENTERIVHAWIEEKGYGMGQVMNTLRLALVGAGKGPGMYDVTSFIGKEECLKRIDNLLTNLKPAIE